MDTRFAFVIAVLINRIRDFPKEAWDELFAALDTIDRKYDLIPPLSDADREAIEEGMRSLNDGKGIPMEEVEVFKRLKDFDHDAAGRNDFVDVVSRVNRLSGEEQGRVADVIFALLDEYRYDIPPPLPEIRL
jgi:hypothetical protein